MYDAIGIFRDEAHVQSLPHVSGAKPGDVIFRDVSGDGQITGDDRILLDQVDIPKTFYGITLDATWKNFSVTVLLQGQGEMYKRSQYDNRRGEAGNYYKWQYVNRWTPDNRETNIARAYNRDDLYWSVDVRESTYWWDNTAYLRLKNLVVNYNLPSQWFSNSGISQAGVYVSGNNLALLYSATDKFDPESNGPGVYPLMKTFAVGARITF
jgi:TonB-dependent starch-binding outer membrane protein SusC